MKSFTSGRFKSMAAAGSMPIANSAAQRMSPDQVPHEHQDPISLRCECSDMRMPKPASSVTIEVPP